ncbi:TolC family protein [Pedosphaera parvula]|uniref:Outer membrane efflux protein n=1 Tax=Pedosphaera parvula (strain Ellin514) TaxID=320771 RepID=B9XCJ6_PEDPL|nr:TolC family protein [Pedosphaera parvula]EEF62664.1 hypothetical protein Cflav_PD5299 [Pedosphaera parvula Ellin514]
MSGVSLLQSCWSALACLALLPLTGCLSASKQVEQKLPEVRSQWVTFVARQSSLPVRTLDWPQAISLLVTNNLKLRAAKTEITNTLERATQPYRDLIPTVNLRSGFTRSVANFTAASFDDVTFNIDSFFNVPGVVNFSTRLFAGRLEVLRAKAAYELALREQTIELYKTFLISQEQDQLVGEIKTQRALAETVQKVDSLAAQVLFKEVNSQEINLGKTREGLQTRLGDLFSDRTYQWVLSTNNLPDLAYEKQPLPLADTNRVAKLQTRLAALELVRAWGLIHGIKLQYWPELSIFVSGPSVYQRSAGASSFWSAKDVQATADFFWNLDTRGYISQQLRQTKRDQALQIEQLRLDSEALIDRLLAAQRLAGSLQAQADQLDQLIAVLDRVPPSFDFNTVLQTADTARSLRRQRFELRRDLAEVNTLFWFVDEQKWAAN